MMSFMPCAWRERVMEDLDNEMITEAPVPGGRIRFYTRSPLLLARAKKLMSKEEDTIRWIDDFDDKAIFWDIGSNAWVYTLSPPFPKDPTILPLKPPPPH